MHAHTMKGLPKGGLLHPAVVLDERHDTVRVQPLVPSAQVLPPHFEFRAHWSSACRLNEAYII